MSGQAGGRAGHLIDTYGDEHVASRREAAPDVFAALDAVLLLHEETEQDDARRGHWEGHGSNEHWVRDQPKWCPVCNVAEPEGHHRSTGGQAVTRVPAALAVLLLAGSGILVKPATLRQWKRRQHLSKGPGYDVADILEYAKQRGLVTA